MSLSFRFLQPTDRSSIVRMSKQSQDVSTAEKIDYTEIMTSLMGINETADGQSYFRISQQHMTAYFMTFQSLLHGKFTTSLNMQRIFVTHKSVDLPVFQIKSHSKIMGLNVNQFPYQTKANLSTRQCSSSFSMQGSDNRGTGDRIRNPHCQLSTLSSIKVTHLG